MIAVVGTPPERKFGKIARPDDESARLVGGVHQDHGAVARLRVLIGGVQNGGIMSDVLEMPQHRVRNAHRARRHAHRLHEGEGVPLCPARGAEPGHGIGADVRAVLFQQIERARRDKECERGIQPARNADDRRTGVRMREALCKRMRLHIENELGTFVPRPLFCGDKGHGRNVRRRQFLCPEIDLCPEITPLRPAFITGFEGIQPPALGKQEVHVQLRLADLAGEGRALGEQRAVFIDHAVAREYHVRSALVHARVGIHIGAYVSARLGRKQRLAVFPLPDRLIAGGKVDDDRRPPLRMARGGRIGDPDVLTDLAGDRQFLEALRREQKIDGHGRKTAVGEADVCLPPESAGKVPFLVKFIVVGKIRLGNDALHFPVCNTRGAVVQLPLAHDGQPHKDEHLLAGGRLCDLQQRFQAAVRERFLQKEIAAGVPAQGKFGKDQELRSPLRLRADDLADARGVISGIGDFQRGARRRRAQISVFHAFSSAPATSSTGAPFAAARIFSSISLASSGLSFRN